MAIDAKKLLAKRDKPKLSRERALSTGSTLLNLACTDRPSLGFIKGKYYYLVGDSASGKTWLSLSCFAESTLNENFQDYRLIFDDVEDGALMDMEFYFGKEVAKRIEPPSRTKSGVSKFSETIEDFYYHIEDLILAGDPFIYVLDSQDALESLASAKKFGKQKRAQEQGEEEKGSYGDGKAKYHSQQLRHVIAGLRRTGSILIIIGQTRDNVASFSFEKKTRSGGRALRFYATLEIWTSIVQRIQRPVRGKKRTVGVNILAEVKKNRVSGKIGKDRAATIPIYYDLGIDDVGSCVDYLIEEQHWKKVRKKGEAEEVAEVHGVRGKKKEKKRAVYDCPEILFQGTRAQVVSHIETEDLEDKLVSVVFDVWKQVEEESKINRKKRYL